MSRYHSTLDRLQRLMPRGSPGRVGQQLLRLSLLLALLLVAPAGLRAATAVSFTGGELLGCPTDTSIVINIVPDATIEYYYEYGTASGVYTEDTLPAVQAQGGSAHEIVIDGLTPDTRYYYRMRYHAPGDAADDWVMRDEHTFHTQRAPGETFVFTVTADSHAQMNTRHQTAMTNVLADMPDFHIDIGDTFMVDGTTSQSQVNTKYLAYRAPLYMGKIGPSIPIFLSSGNHEEEEGWNLDDTPFSIGVASIQARKAYYPTPIDGDFYSGNTDPLARIDEAVYGDEYRENYYAWEWGDALFVVIDPFQYTPTLTYSPAAGEDNDETVVKDQWLWTLGAQQFNWLKETLENSDAPYKFMFCHNMVGGILRPISGVDPGYVRGGAEAAQYFEWGGKTTEGGESEFNLHRDSAVFGTKPIHQLMVENGVTAYFHGHDHQYVYETRDGIVYQEMPSPSMTGSGFEGIYTEGEYEGYSTIERLPSPGHLRITVAPDQATVDYVRSDTVGVYYTYTMAPHVYATHDLTVTVDPAGTGVTVPAAGTHAYAEGATIVVTATANAGYAFDHWSGDCVGAGACSVLMDADRAVTAHFSADTTPPTVTIDQADGQADPTGSTPIAFDVLFSEPVTGFVTGDVALSGGAGATTAVVTGSGVEYTVAVSGMTVSGTVIATIPAGAAQDAAGNASNASTSSDNTVSYELPAAELGDVNGDDDVDATDALIILSADVGIDTSQFCPMNCGDANGDGSVNATDALIILSFDAGLSVAYPIGQPGCPAGVTAPPGCAP